MAIINEKFSGVYSSKSNISEAAKQLGIWEYTVTDCWAKSALLCKISESMNSVKNAAHSFA